MSVPLNHTICLGLPKDGDLELWMIGVILSAMVYGGVLTLTLSYLPLLLKSSYNISRRMRIFLLVYVTFMFAISSLYISTAIIGIRTIVLVHGSNDNYDDVILGTSPGWLGVAGAICLTLASWGADGFMLWRCAVLYEGISRPRRIVLLSVLGFMGLISLSSGLAFLITVIDIGFFFLLTMIGMTIILNLVTAILITIRILYFDRYIRKTVGLERNSPYMKVIIICVESSALIVVFGLTYLILAFKTIINHPFESIIPLQLLVHVYVISPLLIVYRVARGRAAAIRQSPSENGPTVSALCFEQQMQRQLSLSNNEA